MNTELQYYIQLIAWAYFWVGNFFLWLYLLGTVGAFLRKEKISYPIGWKTFLFLMFWLISIKLK